MNGWWLSEARRIGGEIRGFSPKAGTRVSSCRSFWSEKNTRFPPSTAIESLKPLVWPESGAGFASNHWFGSNRRWVLLQTTWFGLNRGRVLLQTTWFDPNRGCVSHQTTWFDPNRGCVSHQTTWFGSNRGRVLLQTIWFDPNRGRVLLQTTWFDPNRGRFCFKPPGLTPIGVGFASKAISILGLVRAESKDPAPARGGTGP